MSLDVITLALAKSYTDQHGGGGGASTAGEVSYTNKQLADVTNVKGALDKLVKDAHTHNNKSVLDKLGVVSGKLQYDGSNVGLKGDKGDTGDPGVKGTDGKTPVKGTDYWTVADKQSIVNDVLAALPTWTGGSY